MNNNYKIERYWQESQGYKQILQELIQTIQIDKLIIMYCDLYQKAQEQYINEVL